MEEGSPASCCFYNYCCKYILILPPHQVCSQVGWCHGPLPVAVGGELSRRPSTPASACLAPLETVTGPDDFAQGPRAAYLESQRRTQVFLAQPVSRPHVTQDPTLEVLWGWETVCGPVCQAAHSVHQVHVQSREQAATQPGLGKRHNPTGRGEGTLFTSGPPHLLACHSLGTGQSPT